MSINNAMVRGIAACIVCTITLPAMATGILTFDTTAALNMAQQAKDVADQALKQLEATKQAAEQAKSRFEGNWGMADILNDPTLNSYLPKGDWKDIYDGSRDVTAKRDEYQLHSSNPDVQKSYDELLTNIAVMEDSYKASVERQNNIEQLARYMNDAQTPQEKQDYANRLQYEQIQLANEKTRIDTMATLMEEKNKAQSRAKAAVLDKQLRGEAE